MKNTKLSTLTILSLIINLNLGLIIIAILWGIAKEEPSMKFEEYGFITPFSALQLLSIAIINLLTFKKQKQAIWVMISIGFTFLALDEILLIHENIDKWIHAFFQITPTHLTDRIDDFIILFYGIVGGLLMIKNRRVFLNNKPGLALAITGFILMFLSVLTDAATNDSFLLLPSIISENRQYHIGVIIEESLKIVSEGTLAASFISYYRN